MIKSLELNFFKAFYKLDKIMYYLVSNYNYTILIDGINIIIPAKWIKLQYGIFGTLLKPISIHDSKAIDKIALGGFEDKCYIKVEVRSQSFEEARYRSDIINKENEMMNIMLRKDRTLEINRYHNILLSDWLFNLEGWKINEENYFKLQKALFVLL